MTPSPLSLRAEVVNDGDATPDDNVVSATVDLLASTKAAPVTSVASLLLQGQSSFDLYTVDGQLVAKGLRSLRDLPKGVYVVHGKTLVIQ